MPFTWDGSSWPTPACCRRSPRRPGYTFGDELALESVSFAPQAFPLGNEIVIDTQWRALRQPADDYTLFVHLVDVHGENVAAFDIPLTGGYYPSSLWDVGELV